MLFWSTHDTCCMLKYAYDSLTLCSLVLGILHTIFFHRYFPCIRPIAYDVLDLSLPAVDDVELETLIESRVNTLVRQHLSTSSTSPNGGVRGRIAVQFFEKRRRKGGLWFGGLSGKNEEEVCWEIWTLDVTIATPRTESGESFICFWCRVPVMLRLGKWINIYNYFFVFW